MEIDGELFADCTEQDCDICGLPQYECCRHCPHDERWKEGRF